MVRTLACHARGRGFEPHPGRHFLIKSASVAQLVEQGTENPRVVGSIPTGGTTYADLAHLVERRLAKAKVAGSSPVIRSKQENTESTTRCFLVSNRTNRFEPRNETRASVAELALPQNLRKDGVSAQAGVRANSTLRVDKR